MLIQEIVKIFLSFSISLNSLFLGGKGIGDGECHFLPQSLFKTPNLVFKRNFHPHPDLLIK